MVCIMFFSRPRVSTISPSISPMASEDTVIVSVEHKESSSERLDTSLAREDPATSTKVTSEPDAGSAKSKVSDDYGDSGNTSDNGSRAKIGGEDALAGISFDFGLLKVTKGHISDLESSSHYFPKGFARPPSKDSVPVPKQDEVVVFEDFFAVGLRIPPHLVLLDILHKFWVQLHQLTPNTIVQIDKFICAVTSCGGHPNAEVFAHHYELHYQNKNIHLEGCDTTLAVQFGCMSLTSGWDSNWLYYRVPSEQGKDFKGPRTYPLCSQMTCLTHETNVPSSCGPEDADFKAFVEAISLIGGRNAVEEFLASGLWHLGRHFGFLVETKESLLSKVTLPMPQIDTAIRDQEFGERFAACIEKAANELVG
jgi:hypothetical protein